MSRWQPRHLHSENMFRGSNDYKVLHRVYSAAGIKNSTITSALTVLNFSLV